MPLTRFCLKNPIAVTLFYVLICTLGVVALLRMGRSILPPISIPALTVSAVYPGAGPKEIERLIVEPIEDELNQLPDVSRVSSSSQNGVAEIVTQFRFGSNVDADRANVQQAVDAARANMPSDLVAPAVSKDDPTQAPIYEEAVSSVLLSRGELSDVISRNIMPALRATSGAGTVRAEGIFARQFTVRPLIGPLNALGGTPLDMLRGLTVSNDVLPGGTLRSPLFESTIGIDAAATSKEALEQLPLGIPGSPATRLRDVADVEDGYADQSVISRVDADLAVVVTVSPTSGQDSLRTIRAVSKTFARLAQRFPLVRFEQLRTDAPYTNAAINGVLQTLGEGTVLTVLVLLLFLHAWRSAFIAAIAIPTSLCATFVAMWLLGFTINVLSLMGLSLTIGILVDDSIVIIEAIARHVRRGIDADDAALTGRQELGAAAFAITLVDVAVFTPIGLMSGLIGEFMREFGLVIVFATAFSLLVAFTLTPLLAARWSLRARDLNLDGLSFEEIHTTLQSRARTFPWMVRAQFVLRVFAAWHGLINAFNGWQQRVSRRYASQWLPAALNRSRLILICAAALCALSLVPLALGWIPTEFSPPVNRGEVTVDLTLPAGTPLAVTDAAAFKISNALLDDSRVKHVESSAGRAFNGTADIFAGNVAQLAIVLTDQSATGNDLLAHIKTLTRLAPSASIAGAGKGMGGAAPISYNVGGDPTTIDEAARRIAAALRESPYATDVRLSSGGLEPRLQLTVDPEKARLLNVSPDDAAQTARIASGGSIATKARLPSGLVNVVVQSNAARSGDLDALRRLTVRSTDGKLIPLGALVTMTATKEPTVIQREDGERVVTVSANPVDGAPIGLVTAALSKRLRDPAFLPPGARIQPRGDVEQFLNAVGNLLGALAMSIVIVYVILAILYKSYTLPLMIMLTVPLASVGALGTLFVLNVLRTIAPNVAVLQSQTLNLYSMLGILVLVGLVAKNGILLVEYAERGVRAGLLARDAMLRRGRASFSTDRDDDVCDDRRHAAAGARRDDRRRISQSPGQRRHRRSLKLFAADALCRAADLRDVSRAIATTAKTRDAKWPSCTVRADKRRLPAPEPIDDLEGLGALSKPNALHQASAQ